MMMLSMRIISKSSKNIYSSNTIDEYCLLRYKLIKYEDISNEG